MTCPTCQAPLPAGQSRCPACAAAAIPVEGALAPDLSRRPHAGVEPIREVPGKRRRERTWKDEVRERVDKRRQEVRSPGSGDTSALPLFPDPSASQPPQAAPPVVASPQGRRGPRRSQPAASAPAVSHDGPSVLDAPPAAAPAPSLALGDTPPPLDLELRPSAPPDPLSLLGDPPPLGLTASPGAAPHTWPDEASLTAPSSDDLPLREPPPRPRPTPVLRLEQPPEDDWALELPRATADPRPLERPAAPLERLQAALIDVGVLAGLATVVVYFAARVAQVPLPGLRPAWPALAAYVVFLALAYAGYFTGTTGQTIGKILLGLRVVDRGGQAPGYGLAALRATLGATGTLLAGLGLVTVFFDPARRALHDRLLRTRVVSVKPES
jgi:uncharacterized RDD family membrane protein YckC